MSIETSTILDRGTRYRDASRREEAATKMETASPETQPLKPEPARDAPVLQLQQRLLEPARLAGVVDEGTRATGSESREDGGA
jgi:transposase